MAVSRSPFEAPNVRERPKFHNHPLRALPRIAQSAPLKVTASIGTSPAQSSTSKAVTVCLALMVAMLAPAQRKAAPFRTCYRPHPAFAVPRRTVQPRTSWLHFSWAGSARQRVYWIGRGELHALHREMAGDVLDRHCVCQPLVQRVKGRHIRHRDAQ